MFERSGNFLLYEIGKKTPCLPDQLWNTGYAGRSRCERWSHRRLLLRQGYPCMCHFQSLKVTFLLSAHQEDTASYMSAKQSPLITGCVLWQQSLFTPWVCSTLRVPPLRCQVQGKNGDESMGKFIFHRPHSHPLPAAKDTFGSASFFSTCLLPLFMQLVWVLCLLPQENLLVVFARKMNQPLR